MAMIDSHAHVTFDAFDDDRDAMIRRATDAGITGWIEVGTNLEQTRKAITLAEQYEQCWATVGVHPSDIAELTDEVWQQLDQLATHQSTVAIGEIGLDFYRGGTYEEQAPVVERFLVFAHKHELPVVFHVRDGEHDSAHDRLLNLLLDQSTPVRGVIHTFSGTTEHATRYLDLGLYLSFSGVVTFKNAGSIADVATDMPLDRMLIETDCPFLAPDPHRGDRNELAHVRLVAETIAARRGVSAEEVKAATYANTMDLFTKIRIG